MNTKSNIYYVVNTFSKLMVEPRQPHWKASKHMFRYLKGSLHWSTQETMKFYFMDLLIEIG